ncbi:hypothetical protein [Kocuria oceani]|uniref:Uncharacterized protein n=1 Tax=Kocuria oceani TaxID=988827 RepID=A0ABV9TQL6_9MICC|nr:hypothetical protein [Kocuria oceani]KLU09026.1 hypothetical protein ABL57_14670 [Kocuria sp. SM24M-10]
MDSQSKDARFDPLVLADGQEAVATGRLVRVQQEGLGLVWWHQEPWPVDLLLPASAPVVVLFPRGPGRDEELIDRIGHRVLATGMWSDGKLHVDTVTDITLAESPLQVPVESQPPPMHPVDEATRAVESPLFETGVMLWRVRRVAPGGLEEIVVSATDVPAALRALSPLYGERLRVYQSPWTADDLARLDAVIAAVEPTRRHAGGAGVSPEGIVYRRLLLTYLDQQLAMTLSAFPEEMLKLEVQAQPRR